MSEEFQIQCQTCGTLYNDLEEVCPYCGTPQSESEPLIEPVFIEEAPYLEEPYVEEETLAEESLPDEEDAYYPDSVEEPFEEDYLDEYPAPETSFADEEDDIFAVAGEPATAYPLDFAYGDLAKPPVYDDEFNLTEPEPFSLAEDEEDEDEEEPKPRFQRRGRLLLGCLGAFICIGVLYGGIGVLAAYNGLQERADDVQAEADLHYQRGEDQLLTGNIELAIAEFERALSLNPNLLAARESLREAQRVAQSQPTPTSETRSAAAAALLEQAEAEISEEKWAEAFDSLSRVRDLNPDYELDWVSELYFKASYEHGLSLVNDERVDEALQAFEQALVEQPDDMLALAEKAKASFYIKGREAAETDDLETAVDAFDQLYQEEPAYLDVEEQLWRTHEQLGDELATGEEWCLSEDQFVAASQLAQDNALLQRKADASHERCVGAGASQQASAPPTRTPTASTSAALPAGSTPTARSNATTDPPTASTGSEPTTAPAPSSGPASGTIYFSMYNPNESRWEILSVSAGGGTPKVVALNGTMPAVSPNGRSLVYRSEASESVGFHLFDLTNGTDKRISILRQDILPRWGSDNSQFVFTAQEPATGRWLVQVGFADGKGQAQILRDGRTPDWAANGLIAYQGSDAQGNNPGLYVVPFNGGDTRRVTTHESDRAPDFSPNSNQLVYMSTQAGNWDIYTINVNGSGTPRQLTTYSGNDGLPVWSPDGSKIAYVSDSGGTWGIYTIGVNGGSPQKVTAWDGKREDWLLAQIWWAQ